MFELFTRYRLFRLRHRGWQITRGREFITADGELFLVADGARPLVTA